MLQFLRHICTNCTALCCLAVFIAFLYVNTLILYFKKPRMSLFPFNLKSLIKYLYLLSFKLTEGEFYRILYDAVNKSINVVQIYYGFLIRNPALIHQILLKNSDRNEENMNNEINKLLNNIVDTWDDMDGTTFPIWKFQRIKKMHKLIKESFINRSQNISQLVNRTESLEAVCDVYDIAMKYTIDSLGSCVFGEIARIGDSEHMLWPQILERIRTVYLYRRIALTCSLVPRLFSRNAGSIATGSVDTVRSFVYSAVQLPERSQEEQQHLIDILDTLNDAPYFRYGIKFGQNTYVDNYALIYTAGFGHASNIISFALYELALNKEIQSYLRKEIRKTLRMNKNKITYEKLLEMVYLEKVVAETLRKYPPIPVAKYICKNKRDTQLKIENEKITVPAGSIYYFSILGLHMDPEYYPEPHRFDPERFTENQIKTRKKCTYLPFGILSSAPLVSRFCKLQAKLALINILLDYQVKTCAETAIPLKIDPLCENMKPLDVKLKLQKI